MQEDAGVVNFYSNLSKQSKGQAWVMTFALKLWSTLLSSPHWHQLWYHTTTAATPPSYAAVLGDHNQGEGQILGDCLVDLLIQARTCGYWDEASVRNAWLLVVDDLIKSCDDEQLGVIEDLLQKTGRYTSEE